jgi:hypothetical protein
LLENSLLLQATIVEVLTTNKSAPVGQVARLDILPIAYSETM